MQEIVPTDKYGQSLTDLVQWDKDVCIYISGDKIDSEYPVHFFNHKTDKAYVVKTTCTYNEAGYIVDLYGTGHPYMNAGYEASMYNDKYYLDQNTGELYWSNGSAWGITAELSLMLSAKIPNQLLKQPYIIFGYVNVIRDGENRCIYGFKINVKSKPQPSDYVYVEENDYVALESVLAECRKYAESASASASNAEVSMNKAQTYFKEALKEADNASLYRLAAEEANAAANVAADAASQQANNAKNYAAYAQSYALGDTSMRENESADNAKYYYEQTKRISKEVHGIIKHPIIQKEITITPNDCEPNNDDSEYRYIWNYQSDDIDESQMPIVVIHKESLNAISKINLCPTAETRGRSLLLFADSILETNINATVTLLVISNEE